MNRRERVIHFVAEDLHESLPGLPLLLAKRASEVGEDDELLRKAALKERPSADLPSPGAAGEGDVDDPRCVAGETAGQSQRIGRLSDQSLRRDAQQALAALVDEPQV